MQENPLSFSDIELPVKKNDRSCCFVAYFMEADEIASRVDEIFVMRENINF